MATIKTYKNIIRPYDDFLTRDTSSNTGSFSSTPTASGNTSSAASTASGSSTGSSSSVNGSVESMPVKSDGAMGDVWIKNFVRSVNWKPKISGFTIEGSTGYAEFTNVFVSGEIVANTGSIGGWTINNTNISSTGIVISSLGNLSTIPFVSGPLGYGWNLDKSGKAEFQDVTVRGVIKTSVFEKDTISAVNGIVMISKADVLDLDMTSMDGSTVKIKGETTFVDNEIIRIKDGVDDEWMLVTDSSLAPIYIVSRDLAGNYSQDVKPIWKKGTAVVSMGVGIGNKTGFVLLDSSSSYSPYMDVYGRNSNAYLDYSLHARLGWLKGITDTNVGLSNTDVWGLYTDNAYIKGVVVADTGYIGGTTGWVISSNYIKDVAGVTGMSSVVTAGDDIRFWAGHATPASAPFYVTEAGALNATSATITGAITATSGKIGTSTNYWSIGATGLTAVSASTDVIINYGKTDFGQDSTAGFILGYDFSASVPKFEMGSSATNLLTYNGTNFTLVGGTITGGIVQTSATSYRVRMSGADNAFQSLDGSTVLGSIYASVNGDMIIDATDDVNLAIGGTIKCFAASGAFKPNSDKSYDLGTDENQWNNVYGTRFFAGASGTGGLVGPTNYGFITNIDFNGRQIRAKYREFTVVGGIVTAVGAESGWIGMDDMACSAITDCI